MFKLVGKEAFKVGDMKCTISVEALGTFAYEYCLEVNGKTFNKFKEEQNKKLLSWETTISGQEWRVVLGKGYCREVTVTSFVSDKETMEVWANGSNIDTAGEFVDNGSYTHFELGKTSCRIVAKSSGKRKTGLLHTLYVNNTLVPSTADLAEGASSSSSS
uniref:Fas apoptotic inhibitory molecule 1 n=1 Tax=Caenorhabditis tropicalis TaxID=1561998 RepID=A0A1I7TX98_9PELO